MTGLTDLQMEQLNRIKKTLTNMGCEFAIRTPNGEIVGTLEIKQAPDPAARPTRKYPRGELRLYLKPFVDGMESGQSVMIPGGPYPLCDIQSNVGSYLSQAWGPKSYATTQHHDKGAVEVLRTDGV